MATRVSKKGNHLLWFTFNVTTWLIHSTMSIHWPFWIELIITLLLSSSTTVTPDFLTLIAQCWTHAIKTITCWQFMHIFIDIGYKILMKIILIMFSNISYLDHFHPNLLHMDCHSSCIRLVGIDLFRLYTLQVSHIRCMLLCIQIQELGAIWMCKFVINLSMHTYSWKCDKNLLNLFTWQFSQHGPLAHSASLTSLHVIGSQHGSRLLQSSNDPQSHSSPSSTIPFPQFLLAPSCILG